MQLKILLISFAISALGVITYTQAVPIEIVYSGDSCDCPRKLDYLVNLPIPPLPKTNNPSEHGYNLEYPMKPKAKVIYSFDFTVEKPNKPLPPPDVKWNLFAKIDRVTANKKDCLETEGIVKPCSCQRSAVANRYLSPESSAARFTRNLNHPNSIDNMDELSTSAPHIMAIFLEPLKETTLEGTSKSRSKRDILSNIFVRPRKNEKRSDRLVKQYNKRLKDEVASERIFLDDAKKTIRSRATDVTGPTGVRPLKQWSSFFTLPSFRNKRDIKGEYDLIEKEREQMDLTLPEIIQYMPETLDPNFKRDQCHFGQRCRHPELTDSVTTKTTSTTATRGTKTKQKDTLSVKDANSSTDEEEEKQTANTISSTHTKRNIGNYRDCGCPTVLSRYNPTPNPTFTYEPLTNFEAIPRPFGSAINPYGPDPVPQQYVGATHNPHSSAIFDNNPLLGAAYAKPNISLNSNAQLDRIIAAIVNKHSDFIETSSHRDNTLQDWSVLGKPHSHQSKVQANLQHYRAPSPTYYD